MAGRITAIRAQKRNPERANVFIEGEFAFGLAAIEAARLSKGQYLDNKEIAALQEADEVEKAYELALNFLSYRPRSEAEVARRLKDKGFSEPTVEEVLARLSRARLVDDRAFARYWIENREQFKPRGPYALRRELYQKGIDSSTVDALLEVLDETESAYRAAMQRLPRWRGLDPPTLRRKLSGYLGRRGFGFSVIQEIWERVSIEQAEGEPDIEEGESSIWEE
ncbi:MAG: RecX family transcriptional regulator [Anaerolineae bacterium]|nr:RecX family transcriptional regulator [Anaerolineae bacterium]